MGGELAQWIEQQTSKLSDVCSSHMLPTIIESRQIGKVAAP